MRALPAQRLLPGEGDDIELGPVELLREGGRGRVADGEALAEASIQSPFGTRTPEVVPFQVNTTSVLKSIFDRSGRSPYGALSVVTFLSLSSLVTSLTQPSPKLSQASMVTGRAPKSDHSAISTAPVSDAGTMPMR